MTRLIKWLLIILIVVGVLGALALLFVDVPHEPKRVEQPVSNETLGL